MGNRRQKIKWTPRPQYHDVPAVRGRGGLIVESRCVRAGGGFGLTIGRADEVLVLQENAGSFEKLSLRLVQGPRQRRMENFAVGLEHEQLQKMRVAPHRRAKRPCFKGRQVRHAQQLALPFLKEAIHDLIGVAQLLGEQVLQVAPQTGALVARSRPPSHTSAASGTHTSSANNVICLLDTEPTVWEHHTTVAGRR